MHIATIKGYDRDAMNSETEKNDAERLEEKLERFPQRFREAVHSFKAKPAADLVDEIAMGLIEYHQGEIFRKTYAEKGDSVLLVEDVGLDSLAFIDISFEAEDFVGVVLEIQEFPEVKTLGDLKAILRRKCLSPPA